LIECVPPEGVNRRMLGLCFAANKQHSYHASCSKMLSMVSLGCKHALFWQR
jgi:hypothetical protein